MREQIEMSRTIFYIILGLCATVIIMASLEVIMKVKDTQLFEMWLLQPNIKLEAVGKTDNQMYSTYINMYLSTFLVRVVTPIGLAIHSYLTLSKLRVNKLYVNVWSVLLVGSFLLSILGEGYYSIFFIISGIAYVALVGMMIHLRKLLSNATKL